MSKPQADNSRTKTVERQRGKTVPLTSSGAEVIEQVCFERVSGGSKQGEQKSVDDHHDSKVLEPIRFFRGFTNMEV